MESDIISMPRKSRPKPVNIAPRFLTTVFFDASIRITPTSTAAAATLEKFSAISSDVTVVPIFAPIMTPTACASDIMPALTKPTTMTVVAVDDWIIAVTTKPTSTARKRFPVSTSSILLSLAPAAFSSPSPIVLMPNRNRPSPPAIDRILATLIFQSPYFSFPVHFHFPVYETQRKPKSHRYILSAIPANVNRKNKLKRRNTGLSSVFCRFLISNFRLSAFCKNCQHG